MVGTKTLMERPVAASQPLRAGAGATTEGALMWSLLGLVGISLVLVDLLDLALTWYPLNFGNPEWEFGSVTSTFNGIPVLAMGMALVLGMGITSRRRWLVRAVAVAFALSALAVLLMGALWATTIPIALQSIPADNPVLTGLKKAVVKTAGQAILYPPVFLVVAVRSWRFGARIETRRNPGLAQPHS